MKLYYGPGACSLGIHLLLEEIGKPYEAQAVNLREGEQTKAEFKAKNPKGKVPALERDDGTILTEFPAIATWLARTNPGAKLVPADPEAEARMMEALDYIVATVHMQGFTRMFKPGAFAPSEADHGAVKARGREIFEAGLATLDKTLAGKEYLVGDYSIADAGLFYLCVWAGKTGVPLPGNVAKHFERMKARPATQRMMQAEGLAA